MGSKDREGYCGCEILHDWLDLNTIELILKLLIKSQNLIGIELRLFEHLYSKYKRVKH